MIRRLKSIAILTVVLSTPAAARDQAYVGPTEGNWNNPAHWSMGTVPANGDSIHILKPDTTVVFDMDYTAQGLGFLELGGNERTRLSQPANILTARGIGVARGAYDQSGGTTRLSDWLGVAGGVFRLAGGSLSVAGYESIGYYGAGTFVQTGGTHSVERDLSVAYERTGTASYAISDGSLTANEVSVGYIGDGSFTQSGGKVTLDTLSLGYDPPGRAVYRLDGGTLETNIETGAYFGRASFVQTAGLHTTRVINLGMAARGTGSYELSGGRFRADVERVGVNGTGRFVQTGGEHVLRELLIADTGRDRTLGQYDLRAGALTGPGRVSNNGVFNQSGGMFNGRFVNQSRALFNFAGGTFQGTLDNAGTSTIAADIAGAESITNRGRMDVSPGRSVTAVRTLTNEPGGLLTWGVGTLMAGAPINNGGRISGYGTLVAPSVGNTGRMEFTGPTTISGAVTNSGTIINSAAAHFTALYTEAGAYDSRGGETDLSDVTIGPDGYWIAAPGDQFSVNKDLRISSRQAGLWDTAAARLTFTGAPGSLSVLDVPGADLGPHYEGYRANFAWGALELPAGLNLQLRDADAQVFGGLYVHSLLLGGGTEQIGTISARGLNIYYDPVAPGNEYLGARTYRLAGGGAVIPVPEPACPLLLLAAAAIAASARRRSVGKRV